MNRPGAAGPALAAFAAWLTALGPGSAPANDRLTDDQREVAARYERLEAAAMRLADLAETEDESQRARAEQLRAAISQAQTLGIAERFERVVGLLEDQRLAAAQRDQQDLATGLEELLRVVMTDPREALLEREREALEELAKRTRQILREQRGLAQRTQRGEQRPGERPVAEQQRGIADRVAGLDALAETAEPSQPSSADAAPPEPAAGDGSPRKGSSDAGGKAEANPLRSRLAEAERKLREAADRLDEDQSGEDQREEDQRDEASRLQTEGQRRLEQAQRLAERMLRQRREEELQRRLASLGERIKRMHAAEVEIARDTTAATEQAAPSSGRAREVAAAGLAERQKGVVIDARRAARLASQAGDSMVLTDALDQVAADSQTVAQRLAAARLGSLTQRLEAGVVEALAELLAAVDQALDDLEQDRQESGKPSDGGGSDQQSLVSRLAELRMLRSVQGRLLRQTEAWAEALRSGEANPEEARERMRDLASTQQRLAEAARRAAAAP